ncbi:MAG TPA: class I SAM-dependent methyltransferase, partial [Solirubrobacteraceae bacterium]|nr:class I SAM-dependent methyltransferase [Solirubrobacteraceae bacterium]
MAASERYVPAAGRRAFTRLYDPVVALTMREATFRGRLGAQVLDGLAPGAPVVDVGCGTGTLAIALARGGAEVIGVDGDPEMLALARAKAGAEAVQWREGPATALALAGESADRVVMSLLLHHLDADAKRAALAEAARVLRPGGRLHVADWGRPRDPLMRGAAWALQRVDGAEGLAEHLDGRLYDLLADAGLAAVAVHDRLR